MTASREKCLPSFSPASAGSRRRPPSLPRSFGRTSEAVEECGCPPKPCPEGTPFGGEGGLKLRRVPHQRSFTLRRSAAACGRVALTLALVSLLLLGCSGIKERQERAADFVESAAENIKHITTAFSGATQKVKETVSNVQERVGKVQEGAMKVTDAVGQLKEGVGEVKEAVGGGG